MGSASDAAVKKLIEIGAQQTRSGDTQTAQFAYRSARMGILAVEHAWRPQSGYLPLLNNRIADLMSAQVPDHAAANASENTRQFETELASSKARQRAPVLSFLAGFCFVLWLICLVLLVRYGFDSKGKPRSALAWLAPCSILLLVAFIGLVRIA